MKHYIIQRSNEIYLYSSKCSLLMFFSRQSVPPAAYLLHTAQCSRNNWRCDQCGKVMPKRQRETHVHCVLCQMVVDPNEAAKHTALFHTKVVLLNIQMANMSVWLYIYLYLCTGLLRMWWKV